MGKRGDPIRRGGRVLGNHTDQYGEWRTVRRTVLARDPRCTIRGPRCTGVSTEAHHVIGWRTGNNPAYLAGACRTCNREEGAPQGDAEWNGGKTKW